MQTNPRISKESSEDINEVNIKKKTMVEEFLNKLSNLENCRKKNHKLAHLLRNSKHNCRRNS